MSGHPDIELAASRFVVAALDALPGHLRSLVFSSPLAARSPDLSDVWQPGTVGARAEAHRSALRAGLPRAMALGAARGFRAKDGFGCADYGELGESLLVLASMCGRSVDGGGYATDYVRTRSTDAMFVFGRRGSCGPAAQPVAGPSAIEVLRDARALLAAGRVGAEASGVEGASRDLLHLTWDGWAHGATWLQELLLGRELERRLEGVTRVGCVHEMHAYSRAVWAAAAAAGAEGRCVQHAAVTEGKRWYFPTAEEIGAGLSLPDVFFVFSERDRDALAPHYPGTRFELGCSSRYAGWRDVPVPPVREDGHVLFAGALVRFDNDALLAATRAYADAGDRPVRVRLHPQAMVAKTDRRWLAEVESAGTLAVSRDVPLADDLAGAACVVGMGTTVLEEALMLGRPVVQLTDKEYVRYADTEGVAGAIRVAASRFAASDVDHVVCASVDSAEARRRLGVDQPEVTWERLFA